MNVHHLANLAPSVSRRLLAIGSLMLAAGLQQPAHGSGIDLSKFRRIEPQFIAALGDPFWNQDPGPRACTLDHYPPLKATGVAPAQWNFETLLLHGGRIRSFLPLRS